MALSEQTLALNDCNLRMRRGGSGPALLLLHGAGGADSLLGLAEQLSETFDVILPDHPGFGGSDEPAWLTDIHDVAYHYLDCLEALELDDLHLVGASLGGWIALEMAVRDTRRLATLQLIAAAGITPGDIRCGDLFAWTPQEQVTRLVYDQELAQRILAMEKTPLQLEHAERNQRATEQLARDNGFTNPGLHRWLHRVRVATQLVWGRNDQLFPLAYGERLAACLPGARLTVIDDCGHLPHVEQPARLRALLSDFVARAAGT